MPRLLDTLDTRLTGQLGQRLLSAQVREIYLLRFSSCERISDTLCAMLDRLPVPAPDAGMGERVMHYIRENFSTPLTLQSLSELFHVNQIYLGQLIKKKTGQIFSALLNSLRINYVAQSIRANPDISFKNLAFSLGFVDSHYFTKVFKQYHGVTPSEYRTLVLADGAPPAMP